MTLKTEESCVLLPRGLILPGSEGFDPLHYRTSWIRHGCPERVLKASFETSSVEMSEAWKYRPYGPVDGGLGAQDGDTFFAGCIDG